MSLPATTTWLALAGIQTPTRVALDSLGFSICFNYCTRGLGLYLLLPVVYQSPGHGSSMGHLNETLCRTMT